MWYTPQQVRGICQHMKWNPAQYRIIMVVTYILSCIIIKTKPCKYFQLNSPWFNLDKGVFSKLDLNSMFPEQWRLDIDILDDGFYPTQYPVWLKPEWGENADGVYCARNEAEYRQLKAKILKSDRPYLVQRSATGKREFEIFSVWESPDSAQPATFSITEAKNQDDCHPVNGIYNRHTSYHDLTGQLDPDLQSGILENIEGIGRFPISRLCLRAQAIESIAKGDFQIIEINLFTPMPIHLLDSRYTNRERWLMIRKLIMPLAMATRNRNLTLAEKPVYTLMTLNQLRYRLKSSAS